MDQKIFNRSCNVKTGRQDLIYVVITSDHDRIQFKFASKVEGLNLNLKMKFLKFACKENKQLFL